LGRRPKELVVRAAGLLYLRPVTAEEAVAAWSQAARTTGREKEVRYLGGGTELTTAARKGALTLSVLIDVARIAELRQCTAASEGLFLGAALSLNEAGDSGLFPLLTATVRRIADRTTRNRLSLGGNVAGALPYREASLPLLLADATVVTLVPGDPAPVRRERSLRQIFDKRHHLDPGELIVGFAVPTAAVTAAWKHERATRTGPVDYPLVTACFLARAGLAVTGLHPYPVWYPDLASARAALAVPGTIRADQRGSAEYRAALVEAMMRRAEEELR
jgi:CO/xanthine dehydrogenase FAD-binding subunit